MHGTDKKKEHRALRRIGIMRKGKKNNAFIESNRLHNVNNILCTHWKLKTSSLIKTTHNKSTYIEKISKIGNFVGIFVVIFVINM